MLLLTTTVASHRVILRLIFDAHNLKSPRLIFDTHNLKSPQSQPGLSIAESADMFDITEIAKIVEIADFADM